MATSNPSYLGVVVARAYSTIDEAAGLLALLDHKPTPYLYEMMPTGAFDHAKYVVGVGVLGSKVQDEFDKQPATSGLNAVAEIGVRVQATIRAESLLTDYKAALIFESLITTALIDTADGSEDSEGAQKWLWTQTLAPRVVGNGQGLLVESRYRVFHQPVVSL